MIVAAATALERLRAGNRRFVEDLRRNQSNRERRSALTTGQEPFATVLGCSDSRVPAEIVFDKGLGDLFVIRVAGNIVAPSQVASIEFAAARFGTRLVVILGHSQCGAIQAALEELARPADARTELFKAIVDRVRPAVESAVAHHGAEGDPRTVSSEAVRANVSRSVALLTRGSDLIERMVQHDGLRVVGAEYSLETGVVDFFDGV
ncbi:MAG TPA: carbonic anhydrase [Candidatus Polarisedimenticolia bacterium]|nr:carbonic anhydrase [Candidatus Polarisedimenticolia bacterium]